MMNHQPVRLLSVIAVSLTFFPLSSAIAQLTVTHNWEADWTVFDSGFNEISGSDEGTNLGGGTNPFSVGGFPNVITFMQGTSMLTVDTELGTIRSSTNLHTRLNGGSDFAFGNSFFRSINDVQLLDDLVVAADSGFIEVRIVADGSMQHDLVVGSDPIGLATLDAESQVSATAFLGADMGQDLQIIDNVINGGLIDSSELHDFSNISMDFSVLFPFVDGEAAGFFFQYQELATLEQFDLDAEFAEAAIDNRFGHTMTLYGRVFDHQMNLLEGVTVGSSNGFTYQTFSSVPEPGTAAILAALLGMTSLRRRRKTRS